VALEDVERLQTHRLLEEGKHGNTKGKMEGRRL